MNLGTSRRTRPLRNEITVRNAEADPRREQSAGCQNIWGQVRQLPAAIAEQIVHLKAEYGMDDGKNNGTVDRVRPQGRRRHDRQLHHRRPGREQASGMDAGAQRARGHRLAQPRRRSRPALQRHARLQIADSPRTLYPVRWARGPDAPKGRPIE